MAEEINLEVNITAGNGKKTVAEVRKELEDTQKVAKSTGDSLSQGLGTAEKAAGTLKQQLKAMMNELGTLDESSPRFKQLTKDAGALKDKIGDISQKVTALSSDTKKLDALVGVGSAIAGGFQAAQGAMALFGTDSAKVQKAIQNIIAVQGILNGVQQVGTFLTTKGTVQDALWGEGKILFAAKASIATAAQRVWNVVVAANPIMLLVTAITAVVGAFALFKKGADASAAGQRALNDAIEEGDKAVAKEEATLKILTATITNNASSIREKKNAIKELNALAPEYLGNITLENIGTKESVDAIKEYISSIRTKIELQALEGQLQQTISERLSLMRKLQNDELTISEAIRLQGIQAEEDAILGMIQVRQNETKEIINGTAAVFGAEAQKKQEIKSTGATIVETAKQTDEELAEIERLRLEKEVQQQITDAQAYQDFLQRNADADKLFEERLAEEKKQRAEEAAAIRQQESEDTIALAEKEAAEVKAIQQQRMTNAKNIAQATIDLANTVFTITNALGKQDEASKLKRAKRQFEISKAMAIAEATISTINGVINALSEKSLLPAPLSTISRAISAASVAAAGAANIAKIASSTFGGSTSPTTSTGGSGDVGSAISNLGSTEPNVNPINAGSTFLNQEPQKVVVLESDITGVQKKVLTIQGLASFG